MLNYESELSELLLENLASIYNIETEIVYHYFYLRFLIENHEKKIEKYNKPRLLVQFLLRELNLPLEGDIIYKGESISRGYGMENSLENITIDWDFRFSLRDVINSKGVSLRYEDYIVQESKRMLRYGHNKAKPYKKHSRYRSYLKWNALALLNKHYLASPITPVTIQGFEYPLEHNPFVRTLEEIYYADIHSAEVVTTNVVNITEHDLEEYLIKNLDSIEEGLRYIDNQYSIKDGRIDILARDSNREYVILELKVKEDSKELLWQCLFYPTQFKQETGQKQVRMITIAPKYPNHILIPLQQIPGIEIIQFHPLIELGKIKSLNLSKIR